MHLVDAFGRSLFVNTSTGASSYSRPAVDDDESAHSSMAGAADAKLAASMSIAM